jgi:hypothetical protein
MPTHKVTTERFGDVMFTEHTPGSRGVVMRMSTGYSGDYSFSDSMPDAYFTDNGEVEIAGAVVPVEKFAAWLDALRDQLASLPAPQRGSCPTGRRLGLLHRREDGSQ